MELAQNFGIHPKIHALMFRVNCPILVRNTSFWSLLCTCCATRTCRHFSHKTDVDESTEECLVVPRADCRERRYGRLVQQLVFTLLHAYQSELFPTRLRATGAGFAYSWSRP